MYQFIWPIALVVISNVVYQICAKSVPDSMNPLASLTVTYIIGAISSGILYFVLNKDANLIREYEKINWAPFVLGLVIVGLEVGFIYAYKADWQVAGRYQSEPRFFSANLCQYCVKPLENTAVFPAVFSLS